MPETVVLDVDGLGDVCFCHATPRSDEEIVTQATPDRICATFCPDERAVSRGHAHAARPALDGFRWINAGSVGMPYEGEVAASGRCSDRTSSFGGRPSTSSAPRAVSVRGRTADVAEDNMRRSST